MLSQVDNAVRPADLSELFWMEDAAPCVFCGGFVTSRLMNIPCLDVSELFCAEVFQGDETICAAARAAGMDFDDPHPILAEFKLGCVRLDIGIVCGDVVLVHLIEPDRELHKMIEQVGLDFGERALGFDMTGKHGLLSGEWFVTFIKPSGR